MALVERQTLRREQSCFVGWFIVGIDIGGSDQPKKEWTKASAGGNYSSHQCFVGSKMSKTAQNRRGVSNANAKAHKSL